MTAVRDATVSDLPDVMNILDGAVLRADAAAVQDHIGDDEVLVAVSTDGERVLGALVLSGHHIDAVAVRRRRRGQGIGSALVEAAADRRERLTAEFDADLRSFYEGLGFTIEQTDESGRLWGERD
ncbi:GNAT family N-acetyltransferase [Haloarcula salinisoli]|uniref:GNAT family N-acetyltransferase n=1 Tax=Haloarcula salinisoli TaxID=2487746 RepID=A0A8J7YF34_9EURY|nr:GNAT family N-acetyltransferase [Halomicroarcula salinisoli]MBX0287020.1 GNAT family N-acetyltransferase [Halomicroarcula salinisoli]MBX0304322.1 GNAT family N-acetyltransferase [Halomicroarcula salinisoli]